MDNSGWIKHNGTGYPGFPVGTKLIIRYRGSDHDFPSTVRESTSLHLDIVWSWSKHDPDLDITEYKVVGDMD